MATERGLRATYGCDSGAKPAPLNHADHRPDDDLQRAYARRTYAGQPEQDGGAPAEKSARAASLKGAKERRLVEQLHRRMDYMSARLAAAGSHVPIPRGSPLAHGPRRRGLLHLTFYCEP